MGRLAEKVLVCCELGVNTWFDGLRRALDPRIVFAGEMMVYVGSVGCRLYFYLHWSGRNRGQDA